MKSTHQSVVTLFLSLCAIVLFVAGPHIQPAKAAGKVYRLKIQSLYPHGDISMETLKVFAESAEKHSNGQLKIKVFAEPEIIPGDQLFGGTRQGVVDMLQGMGGMWGGMVPVGYVEFNLPMAFRIDEEPTWEGKAQAIRDFYFKKGFIELLRKEYAKQGLYFLDIHEPVDLMQISGSWVQYDVLQGYEIPYILEYIFQKSTKSTASSIPMVRCPLFSPQSRPHPVPIYRDGKSRQKAATWPIMGLLACRERRCLPRKPTWD